MLGTRDLKTPFLHPGIPCLDWESLINNKQQSNWMHPHTEILVFTLLVGSLGKSLNLPNPHFSPLQTGENRACLSSQDVARINYMMCR